MIRLAVEFLHLASPFRRRVTADGLQPIQHDAGHALAAHHALCRLPGRACALPAHPLSSCQADRRAHTGVHRLGELKPLEPSIAIARWASFSPGARRAGSLLSASATSRAVLPVNPSFAIHGSRTVGYGLMAKFLGRRDSARKPRGVRVSMGNRPLTFLGFPGLGDKRHSGFPIALTKRLKVGSFRVSRQRPKIGQAF